MAAPYKKNGLKATSIPENDILAIDLNEKFKEIFRSSTRVNWIISSASAPGFYTKNGDNKLVLNASEESPLKLMIDGSYIELKQPLLSSATFTVNKKVYLKFNVSEATLNLLMDDTFSPGDDVLLLGATGLDPLVKEEMYLRIPAYADNAQPSHKIITNESELTNPEFIKTLRAGDVVLLV